MKMNSQLRTLIGFLFLSFLIAGCSTDRGGSPTNLTAGNINSNRVYTQSEIDSDQYEVFLAEERLYDDNVVFENYVGYYVADIYCCTHEDIQIDSLVHYVERATIVLTKYSGSFLVSQPGLAPYRASLSQYYLATIEQKMTAAQNALNSLYAPGSYKAKTGRSKPARPVRPDVVINKAE